VNAVAPSKAATAAAATRCAVPTMVSRNTRSAQRNHSPAAMALENAARMLIRTA
jgi:hypothetical protein